MAFVEVDDGSSMESWRRPDVVLLREEEAMAAMFYLFREEAIYI